MSRISNCSGTAQGRLEGTLRTKGKKTMIKVQNKYIQIFICQIWGKVYKNYISKKISPKISNNHHLSTISYDKRLRGTAPAIIGVPDPNDSFLKNHYFKIQQKLLWK